MPGEPIVTSRRQAVGIRGNNRAAVPNAWRAGDEKIAAGGQRVTRIRSSHCNFLNAPTWAAR